MSGKNWYIDRKFKFNFTLEPPVMKRIFLLLSLLGLLSLSASAQSIAFLQDTVREVGVLADYSVRVDDTLINNTNTAMDLNWKIVYQSMPANWAFSYYAGMIHYAPGVTNHYFTIQPFETFFTAGEFFTFNTAGTGIVSVKVYDPLDSVNTFAIATYIVTIDTTVSIEPTMITGTFWQMGPNPASDLVSLQPAPEFTQLPNAGPWQLSLRNSLGQLVLQENRFALAGNTSAQTLDLTSLPSGVYSLNLQNGKQEQQLKLVVQH